MERTWYHTGVYNQVTPRYRMATNCDCVRVLDGSITKSTNQSHTSCFLSKSSINHNTGRLSSDYDSGDPLTISHQYNNSRI